MGQGDPGTSGSERHTDSYLGGRYIRASGTSVYPKQEKNPSGEIHEQLDLWSYDRARSSVILRTFDTLGFTCTYVLDRAQLRSRLSTVSISASVVARPRLKRTAPIPTSSGTFIADRTGESSTRPE